MIKQPLDEPKKSSKNKTIDTKKIIDVNPVNKQTNQGRIL
ncbi:unnamed protein product, partial [marine sediment metagenome]